MALTGLHSALDALHALPGCGVGGPLHIVTDDLNVETHHIVWCCVGASRWHDQWGGHEGEWLELAEVVEAIACELLNMPTEDERTAALEAWWSLGPN